MSSPKFQSGLHETLPVGSKERRVVLDHFKPRLTHGGRPALKKRKTERPFSPKAAMHLVLRSSRARGPWAFEHRKNRSKITSMVYVYAARFKVQVFQSKIEGNHIQLLVKASERKHLADFLRVLAGRIAVMVTGARKRVKRIGKFWDYLYWSRLLNWGSEFFQMRRFIQNESLDQSERTEDEAVQWICELTPA